MPRPLGGLGIILVAVTLGKGRGFLPSISRRSPSRLLGSHPMVITEPSKLNPKAADYAILAAQVSESVIEVQKKRRLECAASVRTPSNLCYKRLFCQAS
jgi:hypothetical protein